MDLLVLCLLVFSVVFVTDWLADREGASHCSRFAIVMEETGKHEGTHASDRRNGFGVLRVLANDFACSRFSTC